MDAWNRRKMPGVTITERAVSSFSVHKIPQWSSHTSAEHNEFVQTLEPTSKKGFAGFFKNLKTSVKASSRAQWRAQEKQSQHRDPSEFDHARVEALMGKPKDDDDVFNNELVRTRANCASYNAQRSLTKTELQSIFSGAPCFRVVKGLEGYEAKVEILGHEGRTSATNDLPATISFEEYIQSASKRGLETSVELWESLLNRVFGSRARVDSVLSQDIRVNADDHDAGDASPSDQGLSTLAFDDAAISHPYGEPTHTPTQQDFVIPTDGLPVLGNDATFESFSLLPHRDSKAQVHTLTFTSPANPKLPPLDLALLYNIQFVSSHPCFPRTNSTASALKSQGTRNEMAACLPSDFLEEELSPSSHSPADSACSIPAVSPEPCAHPIHKDYSHEIIPGACLLSMPRDREYTRSRGSDAEVVVLDCRDSEELALLARAWCASVGENAVVSRVGRTCIACSVREARALGFGFVIRIS